MVDSKFNFDRLMQNTKKIQEIMKKAQEELSTIEVTGESGAGMVRVTVTAQHEIVKLVLSDELLKERKEIIEDLIKAALNNANHRIMQITQEKIIFSGKFFHSNNESNVKK
ncbi:YbaB/EbfC family nucleoid-associated protein [Coxiella endosymbiont of Amblyomma americanum]|uniref:YbaB/EbfC family nucleoid-associated protein n=1 Tax=Coxiella endosymbiont of Amblyomma americanum TaxID=325775 RepID=UPI00058234BF|nr:YbaB/EbfC family nucleoid-associated protein [Coxiella endosymbiont of Amblyomma americanum]AJC50326.1 nucleoid-associated protein [Coxiella endosymbiont of Amblyomma americanum]AUJ58673.1 nucleoid-associated protein, YbaB/EbfC family [Coxiella-like endosymbiont of Amblyomma americanum]